MFSSEVLQSSWASPNTQHLAWALSFHTDVVVSEKNTSLSVYACVCTHTFYKIFHISRLTFGAWLPKTFVFAPPSKGDTDLENPPNCLTSFQGPYISFEDGIYIPNLL